MTREDAKKILGENATEEQITNLLNSFHSEQEDLRKTIQTLEKENSNYKTENNELSIYKKNAEEKRIANLNETERIAEERKNLESEKKKLYLENKKAKELTNSIKAKSILMDSGVTEAEAEELAQKIVKEDEETTIASANLIANQIKLIKENTAKQTKEELLNLDLKPNPSNIPPNSNKMTWEKFQELSQDEQSKFAEEHPEEFENL